MASGVEANESPRILVVEDHSLLAETLVVALARAGFEDVVVAPDLTPEGVLASAAALQPSMVLLDLLLGVGVAGVDLIEPLVAQGATVLILTGTDDRLLLAQCLEAGAAGLFDKTQSFVRLVELIEDAALGQTTLTPAAREALLAALRDHRTDAEARLRPFEKLSRREQEVLAGLMQGQTADVIAEKLFVSLATVRTHVRAVLRKLGVNSQLAAVVLAEHANWSLDLS